MTSGYFYYFFNKQPIYAFVEGGGGFFLTWPFVTALYTLRILITSCHFPLTCYLPFIFDYCVKDVQKFKNFLQVKSKNLLLVYSSAFMSA